MHMGIKPPRFLAGVYAVWVVLGSCRALAAAQQFPNSIRGSWEWRRTLQPRDGSWAGSCIEPATTKSALITIGERSIIWGGQSMNEARPQVSIISSSQFARKHLSMGVADLKYLGIRSPRIEAISFGGPTFDSTRLLDLMLIKDPDTLILERCGGFYEIVRRSKPR